MKLERKIVTMSLSSAVLTGLLLTNLSSTTIAEDKASHQVQQEQQTITDHSSNLQSTNEEKSVTESSNSTNVASSMQQNLLLNGDFSQTEEKTDLWTGAKATNWSAWIDGKYRDTTVSTRKIEVADGALTLASTATFRAVVHQEVKVNPNKKYKLRFKIKTENKTGSARARIIEGDSNNKNLWYSPEVTETTDWQEIEKEYSPISTADKIKLELFYETGTGSVYFKDVELVEIGDKMTEVPKETDKSLEESISLPLGKKYVLNKEDYTYQVEDSTIATVKNGIVEPLKEGSTTVKVFQGSQLLKTIPLTVAPSAKDQYSQLLDDWNGIIAGNQFYNPSNNKMTTLNSELEGKVDQHLQTISPKENRTYLWKEQSDYEKSSNLTVTYRKLEDMAKQVTNPHSKYYQDAKVIRTIKDSMEWLHQNVYNSSKSIVGNWWDYEIGTPRAINNTLSLMQEYFSNDEIRKYTDVIEKFVPDPEYFRKTTNPFEALGGNLVDMGRVKIIAGLLRKDNQEVSATIRSVEKVFTLVNAGEGFYQDGSYIAHTNVAYTGAYGNVLIDGLSQLLPIIQKTSSPIVADKMQTMYHWIDKSFLPLIVHGELMDLSRGRSISRANSEAHVVAVEVLRGIHRIAELSDSETKQKLKSQIKTIVQSDTFYDVFKNLKTYRDISLMDNLLADQSISTSRRDSYLSTFNDMDKLAMYNTDKDFGFGLSMFSNRTKNYESMNKENRKGWYTGDGMFYLYNGDLSHYSNHYWATVNPYKMPGTTETSVKREDESGQDVLPSAFVGSTKLDEQNGTATMDFTNWNKTLTLHKSWFMLNDKVAFLGSNIRNTSADPASTTIEQRKVEAGNPYKLYVNGNEETVSEQERVTQETQSVFLESKDKNKSMGYYFFKPSKIGISKQVQEGSWKDINSAQADTKVKNEFITISQAHKGDGDSYAYMLIPNVDYESFKKMVKDLEQALLENSDKLQAVYDKKQEVWGVVKHDDSVSTISNQFQLTKRGIYTIRKEGEHYNVSYYDPENKTSANKEDVFKELTKESRIENPENKEKLSANPTKQVVKKMNLPRTGESWSILSLVGTALLALEGVLTFHKIKF